MTIMLSVLLVMFMATTIYFAAQARKQAHPLLVEAREIRGAPKVLPGYENGSVVHTHAVAWMTAEADLVAFGLLELGLAKSKADAIAKGRHVASAWHAVDPESIPWKNDSRSSV